MPAKATLATFPHTHTGPPVYFDVTLENGIIWHLPVHNMGDNSAALGPPAMVDTGFPNGALPLPGGLREEHLRLPVGAVRLAIEREMQRIWEDESQHPPLELRLALMMGGFTGPPRPRRGTQGRWATSDAVKAVRARRSLSSLRAADEKVLTDARKSGVLHLRPRARTFTPYGRELLDRVDAANKKLLRFARNADRRSGDAVPVESFFPQLLPRFTVEIVDAAIEDLCTHGRVVAEGATTQDRRCHGLRFRLIRFTRRNVGGVSPSVVRESSIRASDVPAR